VALDLALDIDLVDGELLADRKRVAGAAVEERVSRLKESARLCAGPTLITRVRYPRRESSRPAAAARRVLPTPPFPLKRGMRMILV